MASPRHCSLTQAGYALCLKGTGKKKSPLLQTGGTNLQLECWEGTSETQGQDLSGTESSWEPQNSPTSQHHQANNLASCRGIQTRAWKKTLLQKKAELQGGEQTSRSQRLREGQMLSPTQQHMGAIGAKETFLDLDCGSKYRTLCIYQQLTITCTPKEQILTYVNK
jgi:hypothetical protein